MYDDEQQNKAEQRTLEAQADKQHAKLRAEERLRRRLLICAMVGAAERGFPAITTDHIATLARVSAGTLFRVFHSKEALLRGALSLAESTLRGTGGDLPGDTLYEQLRGLWHSTAENALADHAAFNYWRMYRATPMDPEWGFPAQMREGPFSCITLMLDQTLGRNFTNHLTACLASAQWTAAVHFIMAPARPQPYAVPEPRPAPTPQQVLAHSFHTFWQGLGLSPHLLRVSYAYL